MNRAGAATQTAIAGEALKSQAAARVEGALFGLAVADPPSVGGSQADRPLARRTQATDRRRYVY